MPTETTSIMTQGEMLRYERLCRCYGKRTKKQIEWLELNAKRYEAAKIAANRSLFYIYQTTCDTDGRGVLPYKPSITRFIGTREQADAECLARNEANEDGGDPWHVSEHYPTR